MAPPIQNQGGTLLMSRLTLRFIMKGITVWQMKEYAKFLAYCSRKFRSLRWEPVPRFFVGEPIREGGVGGLLAK